MKFKDTERIAIATVTDGYFLNGTLVLIFSFLKQNPWFEGDIIIIENELTLAEKVKLHQFPNVVFRQPSKALITRTKILEQFWERSSDVFKRFFSLEVFNLKEYSKVLFLDSDILCLDSVSSLFENNESQILVAPDTAFYQEKKRNLISFMPVFPQNQKDGNTYINAFNSGVMLINFRLLTDDIFFSLLKMLTPMFFSKSKTGHTVQYLLNHYFMNKYSMVESHFNFLLNSIEAIENKTQNTLEQAIFIHYIEVNKPWNRKENQALHPTNKIFGIGLHKTGTTSLGSALSILGYKNCFGANALRDELGEINMMQSLFKKEYEKIFEFAEDFDAFNDLPWCAMYKELDQQFPNSKFILTTREETAWLNSSKNYFQNTASPFRLWFYGKPNPIGHEALYLKRFRQHNKEILEYFSDRNDLLILDIDAKNKWELLCQFLNKPIPNADFPHFNKNRI